MEITYVKHCSLEMQDFFCACTVKLMIVQIHPKAIQWRSSWIDYGIILTADCCKHAINHIATVQKLVVCTIQPVPVQAAMCAREGKLHGEQQRNMGRVCNGSGMGAVSGWADWPIAPSFPLGQGNKRPLYLEEISKLQNSPTGISTSSSCPIILACGSFSRIGLSVICFI